MDGVSENATDDLSEKLLAVLAQIPPLDVTNPQHIVTQPQVALIRMTKNEIPRNISVAG